jgi:hypothetical protein
MLTVVPSNPTRPTRPTYLARSSSSPSSLVVAVAATIALGGCGGGNGAHLQPLSGDVLLPSQPQPGGELVVIDSNTSILSFVTPTSCGSANGGAAAATGLAVVSSDYAVTSVALYDPVAGHLVDDCVASGSKGTASVRAQLSVSTGGFKAHPHDVIGISAHKAYVTRYETNGNPTPDPNDLDEGDDLLIIDPTDVKILGRIPVSSYATQPAGGGTTQARPDHGVLVGDRVYVTLNSISADFSATGPGRVLVIDPATDSVTGTIELPNQKDCSAIRSAAPETRLYVSCAGAFSDGPDQVAESALVEIDLAVTPPAIGRLVQAAALGTQPINFGYAAVLGDTAFVGTLGVLDLNTGDVVTPDAFYAVALGDRAAVKLLEGGAFNLGRAVVDPATKRVFLPDGDAVTPRVRIFDASGAAVVPAATFEPNPAGHLPPREIGWY